MKQAILVLLATFFATSVFSQDYYQFGDKNRDKGKISITPIGGLQIQKIDDLRFLASLKIQYHVSKTVGLGIQYLYFQPTSFLYEKTPEQSGLAIVSGTFFPFENNFGFHGTAGLGYEFKPKKGVAYYFDAGIDYRIGSIINLQLQYIEVFTGSGLGFGIQLKF
jgi:hypothetical protein